MDIYSIEVTGDIATKIRALAESGFFALRGGSCEVHFTVEGTISQIITHTHHRLSTQSNLRVN